MKILAHYTISPPSNSPPPPPPPSLPLTFLDIPWLFFSPSQPLFFYEYPHPTSHFVSTTLPTLKNSLSRALHHFPPFAGNLVLSSKPPIIAMDDTDYVSLTVAEESNDNFFEFSGYHQRSVEQFHALLPHLPSKAPKEYPLFAAKITIFPNDGICIGISYHHVVADARTFNNFVKAWASLHREKELISSIHSPLYDRGTVIIDVVNKKLEPIFLEEFSVRTIFGNVNSNLSEFVRATFVVCPNVMEKTKEWIMALCKDKKKPQPTPLSPYNLTCSVIWVCLMKAQENVRKGNFFSGEEEPLSYFGFNAGGITRLGYPDNYFGNCVGFARCVGERRELLGEDGIFVAATLIGNKIKEVNAAVLGGAEKWISDWEVFFGSEPHVMVVGSPKVDVYETDFGWGRPKKVEDISIDNGNGFSLMESRDFKGGIEVGLALSKAKMDAFCYAFTQLLSNILK